MVIIKLDLDCIHFARQKFQRRVNEQCHQSEGGGEERRVPIPVASDAAKWEIPTLLKNTMGMGRPVSWTLASVEKNGKER